MITIENDRVKVHVKSIVFDRGTGNQVYWMAAVGSRVAMQGVFASLVNKKTVTIDGIEQPLPPPGRGYFYRARHRSYEKNLTVPYDGKMHATYKKLPSGLSA